MPLALRALLKELHDTSSTCSFRRHHLIESNGVRSALSPYPDNSLLSPTTGGLCLPIANHCLKFRRNRLQIFTGVIEDFGETVFWALCRACCLSNNPVTHNFGLFIEELIIEELIIEEQVALPELQAKLAELQRSYLANSII